MLVCCCVFCVATVSRWIEIYIAYSWFLVTCLGAGEVWAHFIASARCTEIPRYATAAEVGWAKQPGDLSAINGRFFVRVVRLSDGHTVNTEWRANDGRVSTRACAVRRPRCASQSRRPVATPRCKERRLRHPPNSRGSVNDRNCHRMGPSTPRKQHDSIFF